MRLQSSPRFLLKKALNQSLVSLQVWRNNRAVAEAFRDPVLLTGMYGRNFGHALPGFRALSLGALVVMLTTAAWYLNYRRTPLTLHGMPSLTSLTPASGAQVTQAAPAPAKGPVAAFLPGLAPPPDEAAPARFPSGGNVLLACKRDRTLYVYGRSPDGWRRIAAFPMAIGRNSGDKDEQGDARTPEGRFWITSMQAGPRKGPLYGALVFPLNYPRPGDRAEGKGGDGIWIHGVKLGSLPTFTHGCISLANEDVLALSNLADAATPIVILPDSLGPDPARQIDMPGIESEYSAIHVAYARKTASDSISREAVLKQARAFVADEARRFPELALKSLSDADQAEILARLEKWRSDWSGRALAEYASNYDPAFRDRQGRAKPAFIERKGRIFATKSRIAMEIREPKIESESYGRVRVSFRQDYLAEGPEGTQRSSQTKTLRMDEGPRGWLITTE